ncbi:mediator of RNA polymerase II transcription subunit 5 [Aspergillus californicus]
MHPRESSSMEAAEQWRSFLDRCLRHRIDAAEFRELAKLLFQRIPIGNSALLEPLLGTRLSSGVKWDPLLPLYIDCLCKMGRVQISTVLTCLLKHSSIHDKPSPGADVATIKTKAKCYTLMTDIRVIQDAMISVSTGATAKSPLEVVHTFSAVADWIQSIVAWHNSQLDANQPVGLMSSPDAVLLFEVLGILLAALSGTARGLEVLSANSNDALKIRLGQALSAYIPICVDVSLPLRNRLDSLQKEFHLYGQPPSKLEAGLMGNINVSALQFEASVIDGPNINSRAGLYVYINAMLVARPLVDDSILLNYLLNRYAGQYEVLIEEIITASFDVLSNGIYRNESSRTMLILRSFLVNKLPPFFAAMLAVSMVSLPVEVCISHALSRIDPNTFPSFSQMFSMQGNSALSDVRQEFLFACASHKLIPETSIERLLGENPMQAVPVGFVKDDLVAQISSNHERAEQLISSIESTEGNAGAIVGAITEVMHNLCHQKEPMTLKNICNSLSRRPQSLDVMLLFRSPKQILQPLCTLLDSWHWDEDQGESQPVYDEFGSILLFVLTFKYRYDLRPFDLGITSSKSFVLGLIERGSVSYKLDELSEIQNKKLGEWIAGLFIAEGISEETLSACTPQEFYMLVSTLFRQSVGACEAGKLEFETLKGGFEYLLEPFLLPSLVVALAWLGNHIFESEGDPTIPLNTLQALVAPTSISGEGREVHQTVLNITARSLEEQLKDIRTRHTAQTDAKIKSILDALEPFLSFQRDGSCHKTELETWTTHSPGGLLGCIRNTLQSLIIWSTRPDVSMAPPTYTHRQIIAGIRMLGSVRVLTTLLDELKLQSSSSNGDLALDIAATLICSPLPESYAVDQNAHNPVDQSKEPIPRCPTLTLRDALNLLHTDVPKISEKDPLRAELVVRLYRRVNSLLAPPAQVTNLDIGINMNMNMSNIIGGMHLGVDSQGGMDLDTSGTGHDGHPDQVNLNQIMDNAAAAVGMGGMDVNMDDEQGMGVGVGVGVDDMGDLGLGGDGVGIDDVLNAAEMNPEYLDLDIDGMF